MIKIGIECENLEDPKSRWGVGQVTLNLLKEYVKNPEWQKKFELYLYFKKKIPDDDIFKIHKSKFKIRILGFPSFNIFYHILMPLRAMFDRLDWMFFPAYQLPPLYLGRSVVMLTPDVYHEYKHGSLPFRYRLSYRIFTNWAARFATKILAISETSKKEVAKLYGINSDKIFVAHLGVNQQDEDSFLSSHKSKVDKYLLFIGQMFPRRHARETILAFEKISDQFPDLKLVAVGRDKYTPPIIEKLTKEVNVKLGSEKVIYYDYIEKREDIEKLYAGARVLIYVSDREAFGLPPMEALAFGVTPIIMDNELGHELFGHHAFYSKSGSVDDIARTILEALSKPLNLSETNASEFVKKYSWKNFTEIFLENVQN